MQFLYQAKTMKGESLSGVIDSGSLAEARKTLRDQGMFVMDLIAGEQPASTSQSQLSRFKSKRIRKTDLLMFNTQLTIMCRSGIDLAEALQSVASQCTNPYFKEVLEKVYAEVADGKSVSSAMSQFPHAFDEVYVASITAGEESGTLLEILGRSSDLIRNELKLRSTLKSVLSYPCVLMAVALLVIGAMIFFVLPQFNSVFEDLGKPAPPMTRMILSLGTGIRENVLFLGGFALIMAGIGWRSWNSPFVRQLRDHLFLNGMMIKDATRPLLTGRTFRLLGTMLQSGIPLLEAIRLCRSSVKNALFHQMYETLEKDILNGNGIGQGIARFSFIPPGASQMLITAEKTGKLGEVSTTIGEFYENEGEEKIRHLAKLLEPTIIVVMGIIVAVVMLSIMLPLLDISSGAS